MFYKKLAIIELIILLLIVGALLLLLLLKGQSITPPSLITGR
jgi:hypothetical protein